MKKLSGRRRRAVCPPMKALMRYGTRTVRVVAEASGQRVVIESVREDGQVFRSSVKWTSLSPLEAGLFGGDAALASTFTFRNAATFPSMHACGKLDRALIMVKMIPD
jgi:hypothetical protein